MGNIIKEIYEKEKELENLYNLYENITLSCKNKDCNFNRKDSTLHCSWTRLVTECKDFYDEE